MPMARSSSYIGNTRLEDLASEIGFPLFLFDDESLNVNLKDRIGGGEVDAILQYKNIISIIEVYSGTESDHAKTKLTKFKRNFRAFTGSQHTKNLSITKTTLSKKDKKDAEQKLKKVKDNINDFARKQFQIHILKIFFAPEVDITEEVEDHYRTENIIIIDKEVFTYFREIHKILGKDYLFRDFLSFLGIRKIDLERVSTTIREGGEPEQQRPRDVIRLSIKDGEMIMYSTLVPVSSILEYITVFRIGQKRYNVKGFQRMLKDKRLKKIADEYLNENETFPNNIIIALDPEIYETESNFYNSRTKKIKLYKEFNSLLIIDGQHRFFSFIKAGKTENEILVNLIHFPGGINAIKKLYGMFYEINAKQEGIDASLSFVLNALIRPDSEYAFWFKVFQKLNRKGFFKNKVSFKERELRYRDEKGIVSVIKYGGVLTLNNDKSSRGLKVNGLKKLYGSRNKNNQIIFATKLLNNYFKLIEEVLREQGKSRDDYLTPREIGALIRIIRHFLIKKQRVLKILGELNNIARTNAIQKKHVTYLKNIFKCIDFDAIKMSNLSASNWAGIEGLILRQIVKDKKRSFGDKRILSKKGRLIFDSP